MERYSHNNRQRILNTHPLATDCRPRSEWEQLGYRILPGATAAWIIAPTTFDHNNKPAGWKQCPVYDIRQVEALESIQEEVA